MSYPARSASAMWWRLALMVGTAASCATFLTTLNMTALLATVVGLAAMAAIYSFLGDRP